MKTPLKISVIIASHRPDMIERLLDSLLLQEYDHRGFEVVIVSDYANGPLQQQYPLFDWIYIKDTGIGVKRNAGARVARGEILAFIDDDCIALPDWIGKGADYLDRHPETAAVEGSTSIASTPSVSREATREYRRLERPGYRTNNLFLRRRAFNAVGGFDERFTVQREDIDLCFSILEQGNSIDFCRDIRVMHRYRSAERWDLLKNCWNRRFDPLLFRKHPKLYMKHAGFPLPPTQLPILFLHCLCAATLRKRRIPLALASMNVLLSALLGLRRTGMQPFSPSKFIRETLQLFIAPLLIIAALAYGGIRISSRKSR